MKMFYASCLVIACAVSFALPARTDSICTGQGGECLFVDAGGCAIVCGPGECCHVQGAYCAFGFGVDAVCTCRRCPAEPIPIPQNP